MTDESITDDYLLSFAAEQQRGSTPWPQPDQCRRCAPHRWHGAQCITNVSDSHGSHPCACASSFEAAS